MQKPSIASSSQQRIEYIDILRGLCMVLIVWYHTDHPDILDYPFYNTTLFFVSGMLFKPCAWRLFLIKIIQKLIIPFSFFYFIYYLFLITTNYLKYHVVSPDISLSIFDVFRWYKDFDAYTCNYPLWFIWALLWAQSLTNLFVRITKKPVFLFFISLAISSIGCIYIQHVPTPFIIGRSTTFLVYYVVGYLLSHYLIHNNVNNRLLMISTLMWLSFFIIKRFSMLSIFGVPIDILQNIAFSIILLQICKGLQHIFIHKALVFFGINSIILFGMHDMYLSIFRMITISITGKMDLIFGCINWILVLFLMTPTIFFFNQYCPQLIGKGK